MSKDKQGPPTEIVGRKAGGQYQVIIRRKVDGKTVEEVVKATDDRRIAADRLQDAFMRSGL